MQEPKKVLLVEDNSCNIIYFKAALKKVCIELKIAKNGQEAVNLVKTTDFDIIFMDINMPIMDGIEATRHIRQFDKTTPIVAQTANKYVVKELFQAGVNDYLLKPYLAKEIIKHLNNHITASELEYL